jgi:hypothetical protein
LQSLCLLFAFIALVFINRHETILQNSIVPNQLSF